MKKKCSKTSCREKGESSRCGERWAGWDAGLAYFIAREINNNIEQEAEYNGALGPG